MPALVAVVTAETITTTLVATAVAEAITLASVAYSAYMMASMENPEPDMQKRLQTVRSAVQPHRIIYGEVMVGGVLVYAQSYP